jgi:ribosome modulation factor
MKKTLLAGVAALSVLSASAAHAISHNRPCDVAQDNPDISEESHAVMFGLCGGIRDLPNGSETSRSSWWNAYNCGYQAYREGKVIRANPYHNNELRTDWSEGWKTAKKACKTGKGPFDK